MRKKFYLIIFVTIAIIIPLSQTQAVSQAVKDDVIGGLNKTMDEAGLEGQKMGAEGATADAMSGKISGLVGSIMRVILGALGVFFLTIAIHAGFLWMTSGGNEEKLAKAKNMITAAAIGMLLILGAYAVTWFVVYKIIWTT